LLLLLAISADAIGLACVAALSTVAGTQLAIGRPIGIVAPAAWRSPRDCTYRIASASLCFFRGRDAAGAHVGRDENRRSSPSSAAPWRSPRPDGCESGGSPGDMSALPDFRCDTRQPLSAFGGELMRKTTGIDPRLRLRLPRWHPRVSGRCRRLWRMFAA